MVRLGSPLGSLSSSAVVGFTRVRDGGHWVNPGSLGSLGFVLEPLRSLWFALGVVGFIRSHWIYSRSRWGHGVFLGRWVQ